MVDESVAVAQTARKTVPLVLELSFNIYFVLDRVLDFKGNK